jgi:uncharacterized protein
VHPVASYPLIHKLVVPLLQFAALPYGLSVFHLLGSSYSGFTAFVLAMIAYWAYLALATTTVLSIDREVASSLVAMFGSSDSVAWSVVAFIPILGVTFVSFLPVATSLTAPILIAATTIAVLNGAMEEIFWRGILLCSVEQGSGAVPRASGSAFRIAWGLGCFTAFHFAFLDLGLDYQGGAPNLVGGAALLGILWYVVVKKTRSLRAAIAAHQLLNVLAFASMFAQNSV